MASLNGGAWMFKLFDPVFGTFLSMIVACAAISTLYQVIEYADIVLTNARFRPSGDCLYQRR
jgi:hypothetical protein